jgi:hypothetical protein
LLTVQHGRPISSFPQGYGTPIQIVEILHIVAPQRLHQLTDPVFSVGRHQQMHMISHQYIGNDVALVPFTKLSQPIKQEQIITVGDKDDISVVSPLDRML